MDCPLVQLAKYRKILKKLEQCSMVAIPLTDWLGFFDALAFITRESGRLEIYRAIGNGYLVFSKTPIKRKVTLKPEQIELFDG